MSNTILNKIINKHKEGKPITTLDKIMMNSYYPPSSNNFFIPYNEETAKQITKQNNPKENE